MNKLLVKTESLTKTFEEGRVIALKDVNMIVREGEFISIMGPSGSGKSTLLNMLGALDKPTSGRVIIDDVNLCDVKNLDQFRSQKVGFVFQMFNLLPTLNAVENVEIPMYELKTTRKEQRSRAMELLKAVGLEHRMYQKPTKLSGGERQRVAIARALANNPRLVLADEPTGTVDSKTSMQVINLMRQLNETRGTTFIIVTHDLNIAKCTDRIIHIVDGKLLEKE
jgi:putative ABC transport system ATP-binding protein